MNTIIGQEKAKALIRAEAESPGLFRHTLLYGPPGLGKTMLAGAIARLTGAVMVHHTASVAWTPQKVEDELLSLDVTGYQPGGIPGPLAKKYIFFLDECHLLKSFEPFYEPLSSLQVVQSSGGGVAWIPDISFVFATSKMDRLPKPLRDRFPLQIRLDAYSDDELVKIIKGRFPRLGRADMVTIAHRARGTARLALSYAESVVRHGMAFFDHSDIDAQGLTALDREYIALLERAERPLSVGILSSMLGESKETLVEIVEPFLLSRGLIEVTSRGRALAYSASVRGPRVMR